MARLHADAIVRPSYVREVCRLLKASNINIVKSDIEFADNQEDMNRAMAEKRAYEGANPSNDLFVSDHSIATNSFFDCKEHGGRERERIDCDEGEPAGREEGQDYLRRVLAPLISHCPCA